jgi:hypothetical protein
VVVVIVDRLATGGVGGCRVFAAWFARQVTERIIGVEHRLIEETMSSGETLDAWTWRALWPISVRRTQRRSTPERVKASYLRQLDDLIVYTERSPLPWDDETKEVVVQRLDEVQVELPGADRRAFDQRKGRLLPANS